MIPTPEDVLISSRPPFDAETFTYSYSSLSSFETCPYGFKRNYIDRQVQVGNFFAQFGSLVHSVFEAYLKGELEVFELSMKFSEEYPTAITIDPPPLIPNMEENYIKSVKEFFEKTDFDAYKYEPICIEGKYNITIDGINLVVKPDAILRRKDDKKVILLDFKTSKYTKKKHDEYSVQMSLYAVLFEKITGIHIDETLILYVREGKFRPVKKIDENILDWVKDVVGQIRAEKEWVAKPDEEFYCSYICGVRNSCRFKKG